MPTYKKKRKFRKTKKQMGNEPKVIQYPPHPLSHFIKKRVEGKYFLLITKDNKHHVNLENIYIKCFFEKLLEILRISFEREKEYHISLGTYPSNYNHQISTIMNFVNDPNYITAIATDSNLTPMSYLHIEKKENDYDKMWTVCTHPESRGKGFSSFVISNAIKEEKRNKRNNLLLEVYNDDVINRNENEPKQSQIMEHFKSHGFNHVSRAELSQKTISGLLSDRDETKIMICNL